jgi:transcriptional regulator with XRE-family HTH domain
MNDTIPVSRRLVGEALRRYREDLGYALQDAAILLDCDRSKISRIETGQRGIRVKELRELLAFYAVPVRGQATLAALASPRRAGWWQPFPGTIPAASHDFLALETLAATIKVHDASQIPDLLQTQDYARALAGPAAPDGYADALLARQQAVVGKRRPEITAIIGEAALRPGAISPEIMRGQLAWLASIAGTCPHVQIQILPSASSSAALTRTPAAIAGLGAGLGAVHLPGPAGGVCLTAPADIARYTEAFTALTDDALPVQASSQLLLDWAERPAGSRPAPYLAPVPDTAGCP